MPVGRRTGSWSCGQSAGREQQRTPTHSCRSQVSEGQLAFAPCPLPANRLKGALLRFQHRPRTAAPCPRRTKGGSPIFGQVTELQAFLRTFLGGAAEISLLTAGSPSSFPCQMWVASEKHALKKGHPWSREFTAKYERDKTGGCRYRGCQTVPWVKDLGGVLSVPRSSRAFGHTHLQRWSWPHIVSKILSDLH